jgi:16S rRNA G966 N2-methylase RsmD
MTASAEVAFPHINSAQSAKTHPAMYYMHKYWARKPHNVVAKYIETYSKEGEIVFDPFCGSGVTPIEALRLGRKAVAVDLDPMGYFITCTTIAPVDLDRFQEAFKQMESKLKKKIYKLYETECKRCKNIGIISHVVWKQKSDHIDDEAPIEIWYHCACKKDIQNKKPTPKDQIFLKNIERQKIPFWVPEGELIWNTRINVHRGTKVTDLFTKRNLIALSTILNEINKIDDLAVKNLMRFVFTGFVIKSSRMNFINVGGYRSLGRGWALRGYWVPEERMEQNVWNDFARQYAEVLKGKKEAQELLTNVQEATQFRELDGGKNFLIKNQSATDLSFVPDGSVDYVFTDPPYADSVPYLELHYLWSQWMQFKVNFEDEIIITDSPVRKEKSSFEQYERMMGIVFRLLYDKLKPNHWMTVTFHNSKIYIYNAIIKAAVLAGFDLEKIIYQPPAKPPAKGLLHPYGTAVGDYYIRFVKPASGLVALSSAEIDQVRYERIVLNAVIKLIANRGEPTPYTVILNSYADIYAELKKEGYLFSAPEGIEEILKRHLDGTFTLKDNKWWFTDPSKIPFIERVPLNERVEQTVINLLNREPTVSYDRIIEEIFTRFPNALTPEIKSVRETLEEYGKKTSDKKWMLKPAVKRRMKQHDVIVELVSKIGEALGFAVIADLPERRVGSLPFVCRNPDRVREIDVLWLDGTKPVYEFEVEHSTGFSSGIDRGSNLDMKDLKRVFVTPEERRSLLKRKFREKKFSEEIQQYGWRFMYYSSVEELWELSKSRRGLSLVDFEETIKLPAEVRVEKQSKLDGFRLP